jgi:hypothetical protein
MPKNTAVALLPKHALLGRNPHRYSFAFDRVGPKGRTALVLLYKGERFKCAACVAFLKTGKRKKDWMLMMISNTGEVSV